MKIISFFNNKGGVGKTTLSYHFGCALSELKKNVLFVDLDPQCNLTMSAMFESELEKIWKDENSYIDDFCYSMDNNKDNTILANPRSVHFLLKPVEDGCDDFETLPPAKMLSDNLFILPGRLSLYQFESKISERWSGLYQGDPLSIRTITAFRTICEKYSEKYNIDYVIVDISPSLGIMNKSILSTIDAFIIPSLPDMFSAYGIQNVGNSISQWAAELNVIYGLLSKQKRKSFPQNPGKFIGYTLYNAKKEYTYLNEYDLNDVHYNYAKEIPNIITQYIAPKNRLDIPNILEPIGGTSVMYSNDSMPSIAQSLKCPMWNVPEAYHRMKKSKYLKENKIDIDCIDAYTDTLKGYDVFVRDVINRIAFI